MSSCDVDSTLRISEVSISSRKYKTGGGWGDIQEKGSTEFERRGLIDGSPEGT